MRVKTNLNGVGVNGVGFERRVLDGVLLTAWFERRALNGVL
jgi:hypothetical protein